MQPTTTIKYHATYNSCIIQCNLQLQRWSLTILGFRVTETFSGIFPWGLPRTEGGGGAQHLLRPLNRLKTINLGDPRERGG